MKKKFKKLNGIIMIMCMLASIFSPAINVKATSENVSSNITMSVSGEELEYNYGPDASTIHFSINGNPEFNLSAEDVDFNEDAEHNIIGYTSKNAESYDYTKEGSTVIFNFSTQWDDLITSLKINNVEYIGEVPTTKDQLIAAFSKDSRRVEFNVTGVSYSANYNVVIEAQKQTDKIMGNFGWSYNPDDTTVQDDERIPHGKLEFVKAVYNGTTYTTAASFDAAGNVYQWNDGVKKDEYGENDTSGKGEAMFPTGTIFTLKLIPDAGYQLTSLTLNGQEFSTGSEVGVYTFETTGGNFHLGAEFTEVDNVVESETMNIKEGNIDLDLTEESAFTNGTAKLVVDDVEPTTKDDFESEVPSGYEIDSYLDISLYNTVYKGTDDSEDSWDTEVSTLEHDATITLSLNEDMDGKDVKVIHETHNGDTVTGYEVINATYDAETNSISFETDGFSNYALVSKTTSSSDENYKFNLNDGRGNKILFNKDDGHSYSFDIISYKDLRDDELEPLGMTRETYDTLYNGIKTATEKHGTILAIYELNVTNENDEGLSDGPFKIKIKMTDDMKKYNSFSIIYTDVDNEFATESPITLKVENNYLVGTLNHLSVYTIVGNVVDNPKTGDNAATNMIFGSVSLVGLVLCGFYLYKKKFN